jgi:aldose 1-epimerase
LENGCGAAATILDYGGTVQSLILPDGRGMRTDVVLGYETVLEYEENGGYMGAIIGRFANRIGNGELTLDGRTYRLNRNDGDNHLHGGQRGFDKHLWSADARDNALVLTRLSPDGEENYPGNLSVRVTYTLTGDNALSIVYDADTDADTVVNLTNHSYFNLNGGGSVLSHELRLFAGQYTENDRNCLPTGRLLDTAGTPFDFGAPKPVGRDIDTPYDAQLIFGSGYDHNFVLSDTAALKKAAVLASPASGLRMTVLTTQPGMQVYSGNHLTRRGGKSGGIIGRRDGICLETQGFPNAPAYAHFPSPILRAGAHYHSETVYRFDVPDHS